MKLIKAAFFVLLIIWFLVDVLRQKRQGSADDNVFRQKEKPTIFAKITVALNFIIAIAYLGFCLHELWRYRNISVDYYFISALTWTAASIASVYSLNKNLREDNRWPLLLIIWWVFSGIFDLLLLVLHLLTIYDYIKAPCFIPKTTTIDLVTLPLLIILCFHVFPKFSTTKQNDAQQPFLQKECNDPNDPFSSAGIWSQVMFMWLNPLFRIGRNEKLRLRHIPLIPQSDMADHASSLLEDALRVQKTHIPSLPSAILHAVWWPLAANALFAGNFK